MKLEYNVHFNGTERCVAFEKEPEEFERQLLDALSAKDSLIKVTDIFGRDAYFNPRSISFIRTYKPEEDENA